MLVFTWIISLGLSPAAQLDRAVALLDSQEVEEALAQLERIEQAGPFDYPTHVQLFEALGIAYAYLSRTPEAESAFEKLLRIDPAHAISYQLSPKVTFVFERVRQRIAESPQTALLVSWRRGLRADDEVAITLEVASDPGKHLHQAVLYRRLRGEPAYQQHELKIRAPGEYETAILPPATEETGVPVTIELYVTGLDGRGSEVLRVGTPLFPRQIELAAAPAWYDHWWVWVTGSVLLVGAVTATVAALFYQPPSTVEPLFRVTP